MVSQQVKNRAVNLPDTEADVQASSLEAGIAERVKQGFARRKGFAMSEHNWLTIGAQKRAAASAACPEHPQPYTDRAPLQPGRRLSLGSHRLLSL